MLPLPVIVASLSAAVPFLSTFFHSSVCKKIAKSVSSASGVYYFGDELYGKGIYHWASSGEEWSKCVVEPGTPSDVGIILGILADTKTKFAVKGGGHATNPGFSSTPGVQIAMYRFSGVDFDSASQTVEIGSGLIWDEVYEALEPHNVSVLGGRVGGVGVAGFTLGGGYSWKTNQYGMTIDTVTAFELVRPDGKVEMVTEVSDPDLFFGLKGGFNNFGIVTKFTLKAFPQTQVWGGLITITESHIPAVAKATASFSSKVTDPKASIITTYNYVFGEPGISQLLFYDGPNPPPGIFDDFLAIPYFTKDVGTRSLLSLVQSSPANITSFSRAIFNSVSVLSLTPALLDAVLNETTHWGKLLSEKSGVFISYDVEPFLPSIYSHNAQPTAFPPARTLGLMPINIYYAWLESKYDSKFHSSARASASTLFAAAVAEGQARLADGEIKYPNYAIYDTPLESMYGANLPALRALRKVVDPGDVMSLAGGFKFL